MALTRPFRSVVLTHIMRSVIISLKLFGTVERKSITNDEKIFYCILKFMIQQWTKCMRAVHCWTLRSSCTLKKYIWAVTMIVFRLFFFIFSIVMSGSALLAKEVEHWIVIHVSLVRSSREALYVGLVVGHLWRNW